jgi:peptidoglycan/LPS O-acetylase OafA/YrhL
MLKTPTSHLISIDIARAVAALGVFTYHQNIGSTLSRYTDMQWLSFIDSFGANYAVPLFFLISGYCIHLSNLQYLKSEQSLPLKEYFTRRILRIYPAYLFALILGLLSYHIVYHSKFVGIKDILSHLLLIHGFTTTYFLRINLPLWTISVEAALYILYPLFYLTRLRFSLGYALLLAFVSSCISIIYFSNCATITLPEKYFVVNMWFAWCVGAYLADKKNLNENDLKKPIYKIIYFLIILSIVLLRLFYQPKLQIIAYQLYTLFWTAPLMVLLKKENWLKRKQYILIKILAGIGLCSYSLYLFHVPLIILKNYYAHQLLPVQFQFTGMIIGVFIIVLICWFSYLYIEKPFMKKDSATKNA